MEYWQLWCLVSIIFFIVEMFTPVNFFLNLGLECLISALAAYLGGNFALQVILFAVCGALLLIFLRPFLVYKKKSGEKEGEFDEKYKGKNAVVTEKITQESGRIAIYGETWQAKTENGEEIEEGSQVKIVKIDSIVMYVEKV